MPRALLAYLALLAGLGAGFAAGAQGAGRPVLLATAAVALLLGAATAAARPRAGLPAFAAGIGVVTAMAADQADARCRTRLLAGGPITATLDDAARPGTRVRARALAPCPLDLALTVGRGRAAPGAYVRVRGLAWPSGRGARVPDATLTSLAAAPRPLPALRARAAATLDRLFGRDAPLARALVVADARAIDAAVRDRYADAGLVHALSVSGLHVAIVAAALELLLRAARAPAQTAQVAATAAVGMYVLLIGAPAPAVRAGAMLAAGAASRLLQRPTSPWAILAVGAATPLLDPRTALDLGYQLSVAGMAALVAGRAALAQLRQASRLPHPVRLEPLAQRTARTLGSWARGGWRAAVLGEVVVGVVAALGTAPLVAWHFGRVSLVGIVANLFAGPVLALLQPTLFAALLLAPLGAPATFAADAARPLLRALDGVARAAAAVPGGVAHTSPTLAGAALMGGAAAAAFALLSARRRRARFAAPCAACLAGGAWTFLLPAGTGHVELHMLDVGQGDAIALRTPRGRWVLFDAGRGGGGYDAGARIVVPYLRARGGGLAALVLSHAHADHVGGAASVVSRLRPTHVWDAGFTLGSETYGHVLRAARSAGARWHRVHPGDSLVVDDVVLRVLAPDSAWTSTLRDPNSASVVVAARYGRVRFLLVGDAEAAEEAWLAARAAEDPRVADALRADVLKVAHHGSRTSSTPDWLRLVRPRVALVSVGAGNTYGHPSAEVLARLRDGGADVLRTDVEGTIVARTDGRALELRAGGETWQVTRERRENDSGP